LIDRRDNLKTDKDDADIKNEDLKKNFQAKEEIA
jgi:hypothetical protein